MSTIQFGGKSMSIVNNKWVVLLAVVALAGCGGGGSGNGDEVLDTAQLQGRWASASVERAGYTAVVLPGESNTAGAWLLTNDGSRLVKLTVHGDSSIRGKAYSLGQNMTSEVNGAVTANLASSPKSIAITGAAAGTITLTQRDTLTPPAVQSDAQGQWKASAGNQAQNVSWTVQAGGAVAGSSTTGCSYVGQLTALAGFAVYGAQFAETCPDGARTSFSGIATLNTEKTGLTVVVTNADESRGTAVFFSK
jgi:hypothetical protein